MFGFCLCLVYCRSIHQNGNV